MGECVHVCVCGVHGCGGVGGGVHPKHLCAYPW